MKLEEIKWATIIPLIGGFSLGAQEAIGHKQEFVGSFEGFWRNDEHYMNYINDMHGENVEYVNFTENPDYKKHVNIVLGVPPCAGLSQMNSGKTPEAKGAGCHKNEWMYQVILHGINQCDADAIIIENAPALYTKSGKGVAKKIYEIAAAHGRSVTLYKTSTHKHGIPQIRNRTFAIVWKSKTAPIIGYYDRPSKTFSDILDEVDPSSLQQDLLINPHLTEEPFYNYLKSVLDDPMKTVIESSRRSCIGYIDKRGLIDDAIEWFEKTNNERGLRQAKHVKNKTSINRGVWDSSVHFFDDSINAFVGRVMLQTMHPKYERSLSVREAFHIMGFPDDFELQGGRSRILHIAQNVSTCSGRDMILEIIKFLNGELQMSQSTVVHQNNLKQKIEYEDLKFAPYTTTVV